MKNIVLILFLITGTISSKAQVVGMIYPHLQGETVEDVVVTLPNDSNGKYTLLGMAYSKKSEGDLETWFEPVYNKFIRQGGGLFAAFTYDVNVFFIPMFTGVNAAGVGAAKKQAIKKLDPALHPHIIFYKGDLKTYKEALDFEKKDKPYFFVLDEEGKIVYATSGAFSEQKMEEIEEVLE